jgi:hypothetical protein
MLASCLVLAVSACGDPSVAPVDAGAGSDASRDSSFARDSGSEPEDAGPGEPSPLVRIVFPPAGATAAERLRARVRATDLEATEVRINGVAAVREGEDYVAEVALALGDNVIEARVTRADGPALTAEVHVDRAASEAAIARGDTAWEEQRAFSLLAAADERAVFFADDIYDGIVRVDVSTGDHAWIACTESTTLCGKVGRSGVDIVQPLDVDFGPEPGALLVADGDQLVRIDVASHDTSTLSGRGLGTGTDPSRFASVVWDPTREVAVVLDWDRSSISRVDLASGDRSLLRGDVGAAESLGYDGARDRVLFFVQYVSELHAVDLESGAPSIVSGDERGSGPTIEDPSSLAIAGDLAYAWDDGSSALFAIDLASGDRRVVASADIGSGPSLDQLTLAFGSDLIFARGEASLFAIDPTSGERVVVSR